MATVNKSNGSTVKTKIFTDSILVAVGDVNTGKYYSFDVFEILEKLEARLPLRVDGRFIKQDESVFEILSILL